MDSYEILLFLHVALAMIWVGSGFFLQALIFRAERTSDRALLKSLGDSSEWMARRIFIPASLGVLLLGIALVLDGPWEFDQLWIMLGLIGYAASFLTGILLIEPEGKRIGATIAAHGHDHPDVGRRLRKINLLSRAELVILFLVVADMAIKPTGDDGGTLVLMGAIAALTVGVAVWLLRSAEAPAAAPAE